MMSLRHCFKRTRNTRIGSLEVGEKVAFAGLQLLKGLIGQRDQAARSAGAAFVQLGKDVAATADLVVRVHAAAHLHSSVEGRVHDDERPWRTSGVERFPRTVIVD